MQRGGRCIECRPLTKYYSPLRSRRTLQVMDAGLSLQIDLDEAWPKHALEEAPGLDARTLAPHLRYSATAVAMGQFARLLQTREARFFLYGSGDFHHLTSILLRRQLKPFTLVSFDNHPDWDIRPPRWGCGTWINRALERSELEHVAVWGCGNFELHWPTRLFANRPALRAGRLAVWPWEERLPKSSRRQWRAVSRANWRDRFSEFVKTLGPRRVYVTIDLDALCAKDAVTNWESGLFTTGDLRWALEQLQQGAEVVGGDLCGAYSPAEYARPFQKIGARMDHPRLPTIDLADAQARNLTVLRVLWPALTGGDERHAGSDEADTKPELRSGALL